MIETALATAFLLGLRHATDPDHLVAVSTLIAGTEQRGTRVAARLGAAWGAGHAVTLFAFGLALILPKASMPALVPRIAEVGIGLVIIALAVRLLQRWREGRFHMHVHEHDGRHHRHIHSHAHDPRHHHSHPPPRSSGAAFLLGMAHGIGGSAAVSLLIVAAAPEATLAVVALAVLAAGTAVSMTILSTGFGRLLETSPVRRRLAAVVPVLTCGSFAFGAWYALVALEVLPTPY